MEHLISVHYELKWYRLWMADLKSVVHIEQLFIELHLMYNFHLLPNGTPDLYSI